MRRVLGLILLTGLLTALVAGIAGASARPARLGLRRTSVGTILVNDRGFTLYAFTRDGRNTDACTKMTGCLAAWPLLTTGAKALAGRGVSSGLIGTIILNGGARQVTYAGHPLYTYTGDVSPGQTSYVNVLQFGGYWPAVSATGREVK